MKMVPALLKMTKGTTAHVIIKIEQADLSALEAIAPGRVFAGGQISEDYGHDELGGVAHMPEVLVRVDGTDEVSAVLRYANANRISRGGARVRHWPCGGVGGGTWRHYARDNRNEPDFGAG